MCIKRVFDLVAVSLAMPILLPIYLLSGLVLLVAQGFPIHFKQSRVGWKGEVFDVLKFRTMVKNASELGSYQTSSNDRRITPLGRIFRSTSLDELPQIINVIRGDMSLVGPRPYVPSQEKEFQTDEWQKRHSVKPGLTGLAQISGRSDCPVEERKQLDLKYVEKRSLRFDLFILFKTFYQIIQKKGIN